MESRKLSFQLDMDLMEPYRIRVRVKVIGSDQHALEYTKALNSAYSKLTINKKEIPVRFYKDDQNFPTPFYEWHRKLLGMLTIYDYTLSETSLEEAKICELYKEIKKAEPMDYEIRKFMVLNDKIIEPEKLKNNAEDGGGLCVVVSKDMPLDRKVALVSPIVDELVKMILDTVQRDINTPLNPNSVPWRLDEESLLDPEDLLKKQKGRSEKWKIDLYIMWQDYNEVLKIADSARLECKKQKDHLWVSSIDSSKAASIVYERYLKSQPILSEPLEEDEAIKIAEKAMRGYGRHGRIDFMIEVAFKLINTYKMTKHYLEMFDMMRKVADEMVPKLNTPNDIVIIFLTLSELCNEIGAKRKAAVYIKMASEIHRKFDKGEARFIYLLEILDAFGICKDPQTLIMSNYEDAIEAMKILDDRVYKFSLNKKSESGSDLAIIQKRLPPHCVIYLRNKHPIIRCNFEEPFWPKLQRKILTEISECANQCFVPIPMYFLNLRII